jgi:hypothetical protein
MAAHLPRAVVDATFPRAVDDPANDHHFRELLGLGVHTPFECVGSAPESQLALRLAIANGWTALARFPAVAVDARPFTELGPHGMPPHVAGAIVPQLEAAARSAAARLR